MLKFSFLFSDDATKDEDCLESYKEETLDESGGEEQISGSEYDMILGIKEETSSNEEVPQLSSKKSTSQNIPDPQSQIQCKIRGCSVLKPTKEELFDHVRLDHSDRKYSCNVCPKAF